MSKTNRIEKAFEKKAFVTFITGGDPTIETSEKLILAMAKAGADVIEIGIPFSDPVAEGIVIQSADERALASGCTTDKLFSMVKRVRKQIDTPLLFMTYLNPIYTYGKAKFMENAKSCGIDGVIVPDMPFEERDELADICSEHEIDLILMIAPTSKERIAMIAKESKGFLYCVSSLGVTGVRQKINTDIKAMIDQVKQVSTTPCAIGFGISTPEQAATMANLADGVIVGSAIVKIVEQYGTDSVDAVYAYTKEMKEAIRATTKA
ncbi:tryptophan synthase subunit alpha [Lachnospiraceae bacterium ZAX-1]